jgi:hypothetical protein
MLQYIIPLIVLLLLIGGIYYKRKIAFERETVLLNEQIQANEDEAISKSRNMLGLLVNYTEIILEAQKRLNSLQKKDYSKIYNLSNSEPIVHFGNLLKKYILHTKFLRNPWIEDYVKWTAKLKQQSDEPEYNENTFKGYTLSDHLEFQTIIQKMIQDLVTQSINFCKQHNLFKNVEKRILEKSELGIDLNFPRSLRNVLMTAIGSSEMQFETVYAYYLRWKLSERTPPFVWESLYLSSDRNELKGILNYIENETKMSANDRPPYYDEIVLGHQSDNRSLAPTIERRRRQRPSSRSRRRRTRRSRSKTIRRTAN